MKKKILIGLLAIIMCVVLVGCGKNDNNNSNNNNQSNNESNSSNGGYKYTYVDGKLTPIVDEDGNPKQTDFVIDGLILIGNRHNYDRDDTMETIAYFAKQGYKKEGLNSSFYLGEWIEFYLDTKYDGSTSDVKIIAAPHKTVEEYEKMSLSKLEEYANENGGFVINYEKPDEENYKYVGNGYIHQDYKEGKYDLLFTYKGKLAYFININETKEPAE